MPRAQRDASTSTWILFLFASMLLGCQSSVPAPLPSPRQETVSLHDTDEDVIAFCGACHKLPEPQSFAVADWREKVVFGFRLHQESGRTDLHPPPREYVVAYYQNRAPRELVFDGPEQAAMADRPSPIRFESQDVQVEIAEQAPAVARLDAIGDAVLICDMRGGKVWQWQPGTDRAEPHWNAPHPASCTSVMMKADAPAGVIVGDLGTFFPEDRHRGALWWEDSPEATDLRPVMSKLGRVSHVAAGDLDGDGRTDLVISEFGWRRTGQLSIGWNDPTPGEEFPWNRRVLDPRHGCLKTVLCDFDGDGTQEIVAAFSQEHESIDVFRPVGKRQFERTTLYRAPDPAWGTSDFEVVDLDHDGRLDIVVCHGDTFDGGQLRPYQGIRWLRQLADGTVEMRLLTGMPGVHRAVPADLDGDGDLDLAAVALVPPSSAAAASGVRLASVLWLEQIATGEFVPHVLEWNQLQHATCTVLDEDADGDLDIIVGHFHWEGEDTRLLTVFRNDGKSAQNP